MKHIRIFILGMMFCTTRVFSQQRPQYTHYVFNSYLINPAVTGIENYTDVKGGYRRQWTGLNGSPVTNYLSFHTPLGKDFINTSPTSLGGQDNNPIGRSYLQNYKAAEPHHGIGINLVTDKAGYINRTDVNATYAYHLGLTDKLNISVGIAVGISKLGLDISQITLDNQNDPAISSLQQTQLQPDLGAGIWLYGPRYFIGLSAQQLLGKIFTAQGQPKTMPHFFSIIGYKFFLGPDVTAVPSIMVKQVVPFLNSYDTNLKLSYRDKFWLGGSYRHRDSFSAMAGFNVSYLFNLSYAYDFTTSGLGNVSNGTNEIILGLQLNNRYKISCKQRNW